MSARPEHVERRLEAPMLVAAALPVPAVIIEQSDAGRALDVVALALDWITWLAFVVEAVVMLRVVDDRRRWLRDHPLEVAIVLVSVPFLPAGLAAARVFRSLRLLRLLRLGILARRLL